MREIRTRFVRDRLQETRWENRGYIYALMDLEEDMRLSMIGKSSGWSAGMKFGRIRKDYPVECECITREMKHKMFTSPEEFHNMKARHDYEVAQAAAEAAERQARELEAQHRRDLEMEEQWYLLGGLS